MTCRNVIIPECIRAYTDSIIRNARRGQQPKSNRGVPTIETLLDCFLQVAEGVSILAITQLGEGCGRIGMGIAILMARAVPPIISPTA